MLEKLRCEDGKYMMECCKLYGYHYLNDDHTVNDDVYNDVILKVKKNNPELFLELYNENKFWNFSACKCECHVIGSKIMH